MRVQVQFWSWFKDLAGRARLEVELPENATIEELLGEVMRQIPALEKARRSMLVAVGVEYQEAGYRLQAGDEVSLFPPVQGG